MVPFERVIRGIHKESRVCGEEREVVSRGGSAARGRAIGQAKVDELAVFGDQRCTEDARRFLAERGERRREARGSKFSTSVVFAANHGLGVAVSGARASGEPRASSSALALRSTVTRVRERRLSRRRFRAELARAS